MLRCSYLRLFLVDGGMGCGQARDWHAEGGAAHVVQAHLVEEFDGGGITAVLAAHAQFDAGAAFAAQGDGGLNQLADAVLIQAGKGVGLQDLLLVVGVQELRRVLAAKAKAHLG